MPTVGVVVLPDTIRPNPTLKDRVTTGHQAPDFTEMTTEELELLIDGLFAIAKKNCVRRVQEDHHCLTIDQKSFDDGGSVWLSVFFSRACLYSSMDEANFRHGLVNLMHRPVRLRTPTGEERC